MGVRWGWNENSLKANECVTCTTVGHTITRKITAYTATTSAHHIIRMLLLSYLLRWPRAYSGKRNVSVWCLSVCLSHTIHTLHSAAQIRRIRSEVTHQGAARDSASIRFCPSVRGPPIHLLFFPRILLKTLFSTFGNTDSRNVPALSDVNKMLKHFFSPLGKPADRAMYFTFRNFFFFFYYEQSHLSIYWTDFHELYTKWKVFAWIFIIGSSFSDSSRDVAMATNFVS